eukprot:352461-Rhodomonas_salina.3
MLKGTVQAENDHLGAAVATLREFALTMWNSAPAKLMAHTSHSALDTAWHPCATILPIGQPCSPWQHLPLCQCQASLRTDQADRRFHQITPQDHILHKRLFFPLSSSSRHRNTSPA